MKFKAITHLHLNMFEDAEATSVNPETDSMDDLQGLSETCKELFETKNYGAIQLSEIVFTTRQ